MGEAASGFAGSCETACGFRWRDWSGQPRRTVARSIAGAPAAATTAAVAAATATAGSAAAAATAAVAATTAATAAAATAAPLFTRPGLVHRQGSPLEHRAVERRDGRVGPVAH